MIVRTMRRYRNRCKPHVLLAIGLACFVVTAYVTVSEKENLMSVDVRNHFINFGDILFTAQPENKPNTNSPVTMTTEARADDKKTTQKAVTDNPNDIIEARFNKRKHILQETCLAYKKQLTYPFCEIRDAGFNYKYVNDSNLVYCAIEKTGSTFWKRILHVVGGWGNTSNPTAIKSEDADSNDGGFETLTNSTIMEMQEVFNNSDSIMFVRDPFTRLFSAWLDKLYSPNYYYWTGIGPLVVKSERMSKEEWDANPVSCASDISFTEFINFTVKQILSKSCVDGHFSPNYKHCLPCRVDFDFVGKYETLKDDTKYLLKKLNLTHKVTFNDFEKDAAWDAIRDSTNWVFAEKEKLLKCNVTFHCALFKTWNRLQSRGLLSKKIKFPFNNTDEISNITKDKVMNAFTKAYRESDRKETKNNRMEALQQAFQHLPDKIMTRLVTVFEIDFAMFGYDKNPKYLPNETQQIDFDYFKECQD